MYLKLTRCSRFKMTNIYQNIVLLYCKYCKIRKPMHTFACKSFFQQVKNIFKVLIKTEHFYSSSLEIMNWMQKTPWKQPYIFMCLVGSYCNPLQWLKIGCDDEKTLLVNFVVNRKNGCLPCSSKVQQRKGSLQLMHTFVKKKITKKCVEAINSNVFIIQYRKRFSWKSRQIENFSMGVNGEFLIIMSALPFCSCPYHP